MRYYKYLRKYPIEAVADKLGIAVSTAKKYRAKNKLPNKHKAAAMSVKTMRMPTEARARKSLKDISPYVLADLSDKSLETVLSWKKKGTIPIDDRLWMLDTSPDLEREPLKLEGPFIAEKITRNFIYTEYRWHFKRNTNGR